MALEFVALEFVALESVALKFDRWWLVSRVGKHEVGHLVKLPRVSKN